MSSMLKDDSRKSDSTLVFVQIFFRHGDKNPESACNYQGNPHADRTYYPFGPSQLNEIGRRKCYQLGKILNKKYESFIGDEFYNDMVVAYTSERTRCKMSLQILMASMFPPKDKQMSVDDSLNWHPIPYSYETMEKDKHICKFANYMDIFMADVETIDNETDYVLNVIERGLGWRPTSRFHLLSIYDTLTIQHELGLELPQWSAEIFPEKLRNCYLKDVAKWVTNKSILTICMDNLLKRVGDYFYAKTKDKTISKFVLYCVHDANIYLLLASLGNFQQQATSYLSNVILELHKKEEKFFVKIFYDNFEIPSKEPRQLQLPGCDLNCPLEDFFRTIKEFMPEDLETSY